MREDDEGRTVVLAHVGTQFPLSQDAGCFYHPQQHGFCICSPLNTRFRPDLRCSQYLEVSRTSFMVPHLVTALTGPLLDLEKKILEATPAIE
ncbi:MAG TPA: hypothetical protein VFS02_24260, partial [Telluria sp.]|nr:hypothetical protein [Telluria sp.]